MEVNFAFEIGQYVTHKALASMMKADANKLTEVSPQKMMVYERLLQECSGGIQKFYDVRGFAVSGTFAHVAGITGVSGPTVRLREDELIAWDEGWKQ